MPGGAGCSSSQTGGSGEAGLRGTAGGTAGGREEAHQSDERGG